jgi:uncharacterized membrane protein YcaP (DUF421 family)
MFFNTWTGLLRTLVVGICAYVSLILLVRISGKRTLSKMNAFDLIVTVALGSTLATILLSKDVALAEGALALGLLILLQFIITWLSVRSATISRLVKAEPRLLFHEGEFLWKAMQQERVKKGELLQAMRSQGVSQLEQVEAVVLETDGSFSVIKKSMDGGASVLSNVSGHR